MENRRGFVIQFVLLVSLSLVKSSTSNLPDITGGYNIVIGINDDTPEPLNTEAFIQNIKISLEEFSFQLWEASRNYFYIKSVDILIPNKWTVENSTDSTTQSYSLAKVRVSSAVQRPYVENPNACGKPGQFIELPHEFFNSSDSSRYGPNSKVLLNLWATFRWGVRDEHGYIGDVKYPYSYKDLTNNEWAVTGCSDQAITGRYLDINNTSLECSAVDTFNSSSTCRFVPEPLGQTATTSLMHFHWIESVVGFCDETNHNTKSPNRQNSYCDHKSVWEVIRETGDYRAVTRPINTTLPQIAFQVVKHSPNPILYIILDRGQVQGSIAIANQIPRGIINFLSDPRRSTTIAAIGTFPAQGSSFRNEIPWSPVGANLDRFADVIGHLPVNGPLQGDFSRVILEAISDIKKKGHPNGVAMLFVKYGVDTSTFGSMIPESEIIHALNEEGIIFNSIELKIRNHPGKAHLSELAKQTGGIYTVVANYGEAQGSIGHVLNFLHNILDEDYKELKQNYRTILKTKAAPASTTRFPVPVPSSQNSGNGKVQALFSTVDGTLSKANFNVEGFNASSDPANPYKPQVLVRKWQDWQQEGSKWTYLIQLAGNEIASFSSVTIQTNCNLCQGTMLVRSDIENEDNVTISVFTSLDGSAANLTGNNPVIIFAKVLLKNTPVVNALVTSHITEVSSQTVTELRLIDNGEGSPDDLIQDGIYSAYFVPERDGSYRISVVVKGDYMKRFEITDEDIPTKEFLRDSVINDERYGRLLPVDQGDTVCWGSVCGTEILPAEFMETADISLDIEVSGTVDYSPEPTKINTFFISPGSQLDQIRLVWIAPAVPGRTLSVSSYELRQSTDMESLITDFDNQPQVPVTMPPGQPGSLQMYTIERPTLTTYFAIRSVYRGKFSKVSDIQAVEVASQESTTTGTTQNPPSTTTTTLDPSSSTTTTPDTSSTTTTNATPDPSSSTTTTSDISSTTYPTPDPSSTTTTESTSSSTTTEQTSSGPTLSTTPKPEKPWAKRPIGIAIITVSVFVVVVAIIFVAYLLWKRRLTDKGKITPPEEVPRASIPQ